MLVMEDVTERRLIEAELEETLSRERAARDTADRARLQMGLLTYAGQTLDDSFDFLHEGWDTPLVQLAQMIVATVADYCAIDLTEANGSFARIAEVAAQDLSALGAPPSVPGAYTTAPLVRRVLRGETVLIENLAHYPEGRSIDPSVQSALLEVGLRSVLSVPLRARGRILGALTLGSSLRAASGYTREELVFAQELARHTSIALDNIQLYRGAQEAARLRDDVLAITSHDLRGPLNVIAISVRSLLRRMSLVDEGSAEYRQLRAIERATEQMRRLVTDLLDVAQIDAGKLAIDPVPIPPRELVDEAVDLYRPQAQARGLSLSAHVTSDVPVVRADRERIQQVLGNLIGNAIKFTPAGGQITVSAAQRDSLVWFAVEDTGLGIPDGDRRAIFERFRRSNNGGRRHGVGLGLAIVRGIVESHGGTVSVESEQGRGSTFLFSLLPATER
jgi:signal transduction histidine kinase